MRTFQIIDAGAERAAELAQVSSDAFGAAGWGADAIASALRQPAARGLAAQADSGRLIAFLIWRVLGPESELLTLGVAPDQRRRKVASALMDHMLGDAANVRCERMFLEVAETNAAAQRLYECFAFKANSVRRDYYGRGQHAIVMAAPLRRRLTNRMAKPVLSQQRRR
ncbi:MAG: GNAT family N-acetyltransferase [Pseudomonadota bacterium]